MKKFLLPSAVILLLSGLLAIAQDIANHAMPVGGGPGAVGWKTAGPCTANQALVWASAVVDPACQTIPVGVPVTVAQGGTGQTSLTAHAVLLGEGTSPVGFAVPGTTGIPLVSTGAGTDPAFGTALVNGGGTGLTVGVSGGVPYFNSTTTMASSALLTQFGVVIGGGAGGAPTSTAAGTLNFALMGNGAGAPTFKGFTASGTGALTRTWQSKSADWVSALDFAVGDCTTDDSTAIQNAINSLPTQGGTIYFPQPPGGCYAIGAATAITLPANKPVLLLGSGNGDDGGAPPALRGTVLKATAAITSIIGTTTTFTRGHSVRNMSLWCNLNAQYGLKLDQTSKGNFSDITIYDCTLRGIRVGNASSNTQENIIANIRIDNPATTVLANLPDYNFEVTSNVVNNNFFNLKLANAKLANFLSAGSDNNYWGIHGYDFFSGAAQFPTNNLVLNGFREQYYGVEADGATAATIQIGGFNINVFGGISQSSNGTAVGVNFATGTCSNYVTGIQMANHTLANSVTQTGTPCAPGNWYQNISAQGVQRSNALANTIASTLTAGCNGAGSTVDAISNKYFGKFTAQTAAVGTCTLTFNGNGYAAAPVCVVSGQNTAPLTVVPSTTTLVVTFAATANAVFNYQCSGNG